MKPKRTLPEFKLQIGAKLKFLPNDMIDELSCKNMTGINPGRVVGTICYINFAHRYFRVKYRMGAAEFYECFKFPTKPEPDARKKFKWNPELIEKRILN